MTREMKNSGVEWIGNIPSEWKIGRVKNAFTRKNEKAQQEEPTILSLARSGVKVRDVSTGEGQIAESYYNYNPVEPFDLLLNPMDLYSGANCSISKVYGVISPAYINLKANKNYYPVFYDYYFKTQYWAMAFFAHGKGVSYDNRWTLSTETLMNYYIPVPTLHEQKRIADFLDSKVTEIDKIISETKASIENYKEYKQSVITEAVTKGLDKNVPTKDSGVEWIGKIPCEWKVSKIKYVSIFSPSCDISVLNEDSEITYTPMEFIKSGYFINNITTLGNIASSLNVYQDGDIVMAKVTPCFENGNIAIMKQLASGFGFGSSELFVFRPIDIETKYMFYWLRNILFVKRATATMTGTGGLKRVSSYFLKNDAILLPTLDEQKIIAKYLDNKCAEIDSLIAEKEKLITNLEEYKKSLIYEYVTGKKDVLMSKNNDNIIISVIPIYPAVYNAKKSRFAQAVLMSKILTTSNNNKGRVKLEKTLYVIEQHIGFNFETEYTREAAGPFDKSLYSCEAIISKNNKWFNIISSNYGVSYKATKNVNKYKKYYNDYFANYNTEIERIIAIFDNFDTDQAEIIATLYGAWNDFLIDKKTFTDDDVVNDILNNWHKSKRRFSKDVWLRAMDKMRALNLVPKGYGKKTVIKEV